MNQKYELLYIVPAQYSEEELLPIKEKVGNLVEKAGGKIIREDNLGKRKFAYPIKKFHQGYYLLCEFEGEAKDIKNLDTDLRLTDELLRHMISRSITYARKAVDFTRRKAAEAEAESKISEEGKKIKKEDEKEKVKLADLDKKLDEILETDKLL